MKYITVYVKSIAFSAADKSNKNATFYTIYVIQIKFY